MVRTGQPVIRYLVGYQWVGRPPTPVLFIKCAHRSSNLGLNLKTREGALSEYTVVPADYITTRPPNLTPTQAAGISLAGMTGYQALFQVAKLEAGQTVFINGGSTSVGAFAIIFAKARGIKVVASASGKNEAFVRKMGADEVRYYLDFSVILDSILNDPNALLLSSSSLTTLKKT